MKILSKRLLLLCSLFVASVTYAAPSADELLQSCEDRYLQQDYADALAYGKQALPLCEGTDMEADKPSTTHSAASGWMPRRATPTS